MLIITSPTSTTWTPKHVSHNTTPRRQSVCSYSYTPHSVHMLDHHQHHRNIAMHNAQLMTRLNDFVPSMSPNTSRPSPKSRKPWSVDNTTKSIDIIKIITQSIWCIVISIIEICELYNIKLWYVKMNSNHLFLSHRDLSLEKTRIFIENTFFSRFRSTMSTLSIILVESTQNTFNYEEESSLGERAWLE